MPEVTLGPETLIRCLFGAQEYLERNYDILNNLNVFPVPDGDTGTNMLSTFEAGIRVLKSGDYGSLGDIAGIMNAELTRHSRGNSGFILARFFHGFFEVAGKHSSLDHHQLADGFTAGLFQVKSSLFSPVEGTMITIIRAMEDSFKEGDDGDLTVSLETALAAAREALKETPRLLPVLAKAGVVDSGALGFIFLMEGFSRVLKGLSMEREQEEDYRFPPETSGSAVVPEVKNFGYCTEVTILRPRLVPREEVTAYLETRGDSIALVREDDFLKVHIHTDIPGEIIEYMKTLGAVEHVKIDNLKEQISRFSGEGMSGDDCAVLAFIPGEGFREIFQSLGVNHCILYTSHLPSAGEILDALEEMPEKNFILLPNNKNILPAAMTAAKKTDKHVAVLHTVDVVQGLATSYGYSANDGIDDNVTSMKECMNLARGIFVYRSNAAAEFDGRVIGSGDYFSLINGSLAAVGDSLSEVVLSSVELSDIDGCENLSLYYGDLCRPEDCSRLTEDLKKRKEDLEVELLAGGQTRELLILALE
ncbi:MAG: DAK2 domain-containing protein [Spirochaetales bacterium]|nr:DAK2 domain-containing protein [Spirochaetales bacterium]